MHILKTVTRKYETVVKSNVEMKSYAVLKTENIDEFVDLVNTELTLHSIDVTVTKDDIRCGGTDIHDGTEKWPNGKLMYVDKRLFSHIHMEYTHSENDKDEHGGYFWDVFKEEED